MSTDSPLRRPRTVRIPVMLGALITLVGSGVAVHALLSPAGAEFMPHGMCFLWSPTLVWSNVIADGIIAGSYIAIAAGLTHLVVHNRRLLPYHWMFLAFATFILACAGTHIMDIVTLWLPAYWLSADMKFITAGASAVTAFAVPLAVLRATVTLSRADLANQCEFESRRAKKELERQTVERALQLARANAELEHAIAMRVCEVVPIVHDEGRSHGTDRPKATSGPGSDAGINLVVPYANDDLARIEDLVQIAAANARRNEDDARRKALDEGDALLKEGAECGRSALELERRIAAFANDLDEAGRLEAMAELARTNVALEERLVDRTVEVERLNARLTQQLRELGRAYSDLECYAGALQEHEEQQRTHAHQLRTLHAIASATTAQGASQIRSALELGLASLNLDWAYHGIIDSATGELVVQDSFGRDGQLVIPSGARVPLQSTIIGPLLTRPSRAIIVIDDARKLERPSLFGGWRSCIAAPLFIGDEPYGVIGFTSRELKAERFSQANIEFIAVAGELITSGAERRQRNAQVEASEARYRALADAMPQLVWVIDAQGVVEYVNRNCSEYTGYSLDRSRALGLAAIYEAEAVADDQKNRELSPTGFEGEARLRRFDGSYRWHLIRSVAFSGTSTMVGKWVVTATDIEERKRSENVSASAHAAALAATESKSRFLATMSHEIRTPMNGIVGMTELLLLTALTDEQRGYAQIVRDSGESLLRVINDILDYSKIEAGKIDIEQVSFAIRGQVESVAELLELQFRAKKVTLATHIGPDVPATVQGDPGRVRQILLNLVGNALKFTAAGGSVEIRVVAARAIDGRMPVRFTVVDTGIGIAPAGIGQLFQPFTQVDSSTTRQYGGTGLGLSICAHLVALMDGSIGVESVEAQGSSFWFEIPFVSESDRGSTIERAAANNAFEDEPVHTRRERILVVDDNDINALLAIKQFRRLGFAIVAVSSGRECIERVEREPFDLIFMDCQMPEMDGFATTRELRIRLGETARIPIVAITADARDEDRQRCLEAGMDDYLAKPASLAQIAAVVERWLPLVERRRYPRPQSPAKVPVPVLSVAVLLESFDGDAVALMQILRAASQSIRFDAARIERAVAARNRDIVLEASRGLKATGTTIRSARIVELSQALEQDAAVEQWSHTPSLLGALRDGIFALEGEIERFLAEHAVDR